LTGVKEDIDALMNGEELSEEFKQKATTIYEAAVMNRVKQEIARLEEEFEAKLQESVAQNVEGLVEQVDGYLGYVAEQWIAQNEIALERGMKSEILEGFVDGLKDLFEEHYIDVPEERFDVLGEMEQKMSELESKLNEQVAANIEMSKALAEGKRTEIVKTVSEGLTDTQNEKFLGLVEELSYDDSESFEKKVKTIRENYFTTKATSDVKSVVTDAPVEALTESKKLDPIMSAYLSALKK
jgi:tRNA 2-selenouridine synthase SelU